MTRRAALARASNLRVLRWRAVARDGPNCSYCGVPTVVLPYGEIPADFPWHRLRTLDHLIPVSKGGKDVLENLVISCVDCNERKGSRPACAFAPRLRREK